jgi:hypothetical protein
MWTCLIEICTESHRLLLVAKPLAIYPSVLTLYFYTPSASTHLLPTLASVIRVFQPRLPAHAPPCALKEKES